MTEQLRELGPDAVVWLIAMACLVGVALAALAAALVTVAITELRSWWWRWRAWRTWRAALPLHRRLHGGRDPLSDELEPGKRRRWWSRWWRRRRRWRDERRGR